MFTARAVALSRRSTQNLETIREDAGTFVDIVKFAMRGLRAPTVASFGEGNLLGGQQPQCTAVPRVSGSRRLVFVAVLVSAGLVAGAAALAAAPYSLLGREAPDFASARHRRQQRAPVGASGRGGGAQLLGQPLRSVPHAARGARSAVCRRTSRQGSRCSASMSMTIRRARSSLRRAQSVGFPLLLDPEKTVSRRYHVDNLPMTRAHRPRRRSCATCIATTAARKMRCTCSSCARC